MIPALGGDFSIELEQEQIASHDFGLDEEKKRIRGTVDDLEEVKQAVYFIVNTHRYRHIIYPWSYGIEIDDLIGKPKSYAYPELERRIRDALLEDDRIEAVTDFEFSDIKNRVRVNFKVHSIFGVIEGERMVDL